MSRLPHPFLGGEMPPKQPQTPSGPGFLLMTRPPSGSNSYGWRGPGGGGGPFTPFTPSHRHAPSPSDYFIPLSASGSNNIQDSGRRGRGGRHSQGGRGQGSPRHFSPYQSSPRGGGGGGEWPMGSPGHHQGVSFTPTRPRGHRDSFSNPRQRFSFNGSSRGGRERGPISDIPVEKFVSPSMVRDPWAEFDLPTTVPTPDPLRRTSTVPLLDDSEIIIDSDTSVVVENSYEGAVSGTEGDSSPVPDTGSDSPYVATSSTSDKDGASDSTGDD